MAPTDFQHDATKSTQLANERGAALLIVLVMLLLLTILGATLFTSSTTEIKIAGNYRNTLETFSAADAAAEFAMIYDKIYTSLIPGTTASSWPNAGEGKLLNNDLTEGDPNTENRNFNRINIPGTNVKADIKVDLIAARNNPPPGYGYQEDAGVGAGGEASFKSNVFAITVEAHGPNNARADVEAGMARVVPH
ncbi:hypothetical protein KI811_02830 [Geobacter hydrogenophilus]|uniref:Type 4 fimbrial biogenesis protein PilX N-terminal domain-containing protein n=1 Tax=Geobacter hydrogenophilus TaxID=40983 RepID=A0A9W6G1R8_9BACT|nr:PilX N-terminal domain-containing pilus assembly protein [Geobacter hydrogenophilus]MBT0892759.1 hypothetical protein [Geobacter hydrogenophilus]GLI38768.1 hypothetical protein GHYDROH2_22690 [Geobacter hydrogenophilus]